MWLLQPLNNTYLYLKNTFSVERNIYDGEYGLVGNALNHGNLAGTDAIITSL